jgi:hypothetical protein
MSRNAFFLSILAFGVASGLIFAQVPNPPAQKLNPREIQTIEHIAQAYYQNETRSVLEKLSRLVARMNDGNVESLNRELSLRKLPDSAMLLTEARIAYVQQGLSKQLPKPGPREALAVLQTLNKQVQQTVEATANEPATSPLLFPTTPDAWAKALWKLHVLENRLETARLMADYMGVLAKGYPAGGANRLDENNRKLVESDHKQLATQLRQAAAEVEAREIALRIDRLKVATERLEDPALDSARFFAAYTAALDSRIILDYFERTKSDEVTTQNDPALGEGALETTRALANRAKELSQDLSEKAALFYEGLHWWLRGRYGMGPDAGGLAKSPDAMHSLAAQFGLYMPSETPRPTGPSDTNVKESVPTLDRRHHYWWAWEDRRLQRGGLSSSTRTTAAGDNFSVTLSRFW